MPNKERIPVDAVGTTPAKRLGRAQKILLIASVGVAVIGLTLQVVAWAIGPDDATPAPASGTSGGTDSGLVSGLAPTTTDNKSASGTTTDPAESSALDAWSPAIFRLGFSFFVGFCVAYALRAFVKTALITIGLLLIALFALQSAGVVDVDWAGMGRHFDTAVRWARAQATSFHDLLTGYLPSAASAGAGLFMGFRRG